VMICPWSCLEKATAMARACVRSAVPCWSNEKGQMLAITALAVFAFVGIAGMAVDLGILTVQRGRLVHLADSAALAAASGMDTRLSAAELQGRAERIADEYLALNGFGSGSDFCRPETIASTVSVQDVPDPSRPGMLLKQVSVETRCSVELSLMAALGFTESDATSGTRLAQTLPSDVALVQDTSISQVIRNYCVDQPQALVRSGWWGQRYRCSSIPFDAVDPNLAYRTDYSNRTFSYDPEDATSRLDWDRAILDPAYSPNVPWLPFARQQWGARYLVGQLNTSYDQIAVVGVSTAHTTLLSLTTSKNDALDTIGNSPEGWGESGEVGLSPGGGANVGAGIRAGVQALTDPVTSRIASSGALILVTDSSPGAYQGNCKLSDLSNADCEAARQDAMNAANEAVAKGITIYVVFYDPSVCDNGHGSFDASCEPEYASTVKWIAERADSTEASPSPNYHRVDADDPDPDVKLREAYDSILDDIHRRAGARLVQ
jgi:hypothetical protein